MTVVTSAELVMPSNHLILCRPLFLLRSIFPSIRVFSNESALRIRWPKYWSFSFNISPSNEHPGLIFRNGLLTKNNRDIAFQRKKQKLFQTKRKAKLIILPREWQGRTRSVQVRWNKIKQKVVPQIALQITPHLKFAYKK